MYRPGQATPWTETFYFLRLGCTDRVLVPKTRREQEVRVRERAFITTTTEYRFRGYRLCSIYRLAKKSPFLNVKGLLDS